MAKHLKVWLAYNEILEQAKGVPILSCKIRHGQENNGMASRTRLWHSCDKRTVIEAVHA